MSAGNIKVEETPDMMGFMAASTGNDIFKHENGTYKAGIKVPCFDILRSS